ncbi:MAG: histidine triad nucleotide-binding protein [Alphaproteobacteria bacterium]|nr:histidine triad nucleotide-binding protein [Alphaproteobacteria bacterium]
MNYDDQNIFARIIRGEIPCTRLYDDEFVMAFADIRPQAPVHLLVIPKQAFVSAQDFGERATAAQTQAIFRAVASLARDHGVAESGYRLISNCGLNGHQEVPHFHLHLLAGRPLGAMVARS